MTSTNPAHTDALVNPHNFIRRNKLYGNTSKYTKPGKPNGDLKRSDGNAIIIDYNNHKNPPTLIENNIVSNNGGRGIHIFQSSNVVVRNNSTYNNSTDPHISANGGGGELTAINGTNIRFYNNASYGMNGVPNFRVAKAYGYTGPLSVTIRACTYFGNFGVVPESGVTDWTTTFHGNPHYVSASTNNLFPNVAPLQDGKTLAQSQTLIDRASNINGDFAAKDYYQNSRPQGAAIDRGAFETSLPAPAQGTSAGAG